MPVAARIIDQIRRAHDGHPWHGSPVKAILTGLTAPQAPTYELLHGIVQHDAYHAGQMALLKRLGRV